MIRLPEDGAKDGAKLITVLICTKSRRVSIASRCFYEEEKHGKKIFPAQWEWSKWKGNSVTHWMPLPSTEEITHDT